MATIIEDFWANVNVGKPDECWDWQRGCDGNKYGAFKTRNRIYLAHRHAYELINGSIPDGMYVCHSCDNRLCCNPAHLWAGTQSDNVRDMFRKGRGNRPIKITPSVIDEIHAQRKQGKSTKGIAAHFSLSSVAVQTVLRGEYGVIVQEQLDQIAGLIKE